MATNGTLRLAACAAALTLAFPGTALAGGWLPGPAPISGPQSASNLQTAAGVDGTAAAVWTDGTTVLAAIKRSGSPAFDAPVAIGSGAEPDIAVGRTGAVLAVWTTSGGIRAAEHTRETGAFTDLGLISTESGAQKPQAAYFADGRVGVKLEQTGGISAIVRQVRGGPFEAAGTLEPISGTITGSDMAISDQSAEILVVATVDDGASTRLVYVTRSVIAGGSSTDIDPLADSGDADDGTTHVHSEPRLLVGGLLVGSRIVIAYVTTSATTAMGAPAGTATSVKSVVLPTSGPPQLGTIDAATNDGVAGPTLTSPALTERTDGTTSAAWLKLNPVGTPALSSADLLPAATAFGAKDDIEGYGSQGAALGAPAIAPILTEIVAMIAPDGPAVQAAFSLKGRAFGEPLDIFAGADQPSGATLTGDGRGGLAAVWMLQEGGSRRPWARLYDDGLPTIATPNTPATLAAGQAGPFVAAASDSWTGAVPVWDFGDGQSAFGASVTHAYSAPGRYVVSVRAQDAAGNQSDPIERELVVPLTAGGGGSPDRTAPRITNLSLSNKRFAVAAQTKKPATVKRGTRVRFRLSENAAVTMTVRRTIRGYRSGGKCVTKKPAAKKPARCNIQRTIGTVSATGKSGSNSLAFKGRVKGRALAAGSYRLALVAVDTARNRSRTVSTTFTIARVPKR